MTLVSKSALRIAATFALSTSLAASVMAGDVVATEATVNAKSVALFEIPCSDAGDSTRGIAVSDDDKKFSVVHFGPAQGAAPISLVAMSQEQCVNIIPLVAELSLSGGHFLFPEEGVRFVKFETDLGTTVHCTVKIDAERAADGAFLQHLGDPDVYQPLFPGEYKEVTSDQDPPAGESDRVAFVIIHYMLSATTYDEPWTVSTDHKNASITEQWGNIMWKLAQEHPASSYAPYAAFYAGSCYVTCLAQRNKDLGGRMYSVDAAATSYYQKARAAVDFVLAHGDRYLQPRGFYLRAFLESCSAEWDSAAASLMQAKQAAPWSRQLDTSANKLLLEIEAITERESDSRTIP